jgi:hypothetical protein
MAQDLKAEVREGHQRLLKIWRGLEFQPIRGTI